MVLGDVASIPTQPAGTHGAPLYAKSWEYSRTDRNSPGLPFPPRPPSTEHRCGLQVCGWETGRDSCEDRVGRAGSQRSGISLTLSPRVGFGEGDTWETGQAEASGMCPGSLPGHQPRTSFLPCPLQAAKLKARLTLMEGWLQGSDCGRPWGPVDILQGEAPRGDIYQGHHVLPGTVGDQGQGGGAGWADTPFGALQSGLRIL